MLTVQQQSFLDLAAPASVTSELSTGLPAALTLSQAIFESAWGARAPGNNYFGIKADAHGSGVQYCLTEEFINGEWEKEPLAFEKYDTLTDCFIDHARLITQGAPYQPAWAQYQIDHDVDNLILSIGPLYATAPGYAQTILDESHSTTVTNALQQARTKLG